MDRVLRPAGNGANHSHDTEAWHFVCFRLLNPLLKTAFPNDPDLLIEIQRFWNEPPFVQLVPTGLSLTACDISKLAIKAIRWLKVCPVPR